jgi:hypothetical protein
MNIARAMTSRSSPYSTHKIPRPRIVPSPAN